MSTPRWIEFVTRPGLPDRLTGVWAVKSKDGGAALGEVRWFGRWRRYAFYPLPGTVFEQECLHDIAEFCDARTKEWRINKKAARERAADGPR